MLSNDHTSHSHLHCTDTFQVWHLVSACFIILVLFSSYLNVYISVFSTLVSFCECFQSTLHTLNVSLCIQSSSTSLPSLPPSLSLSLQLYVVYCHCCHSDHFILMSLICRRGQLCLGPDSHKGNVQCACALVACHLLKDNFSNKSWRLKHHNVSVLSVCEGMLHACLCVCGNMHMWRVCEGGNPTTQQLGYSSSSLHSQQQGVEKGKTMLRFREEKSYPGKTDYKAVLLENRLCTAFILTHKYFRVRREVFSMTS